MSTVALFLMGVVVSLLTVAALSLLVYAAILDGRINDEHANSVPGVIEFPPTSREPDLGRAA
jgi:hypothetical protein